jgi:Ca-activated chloride channel homolog
VNRKTLSIIAVAGALVAAAIILGTGTGSRQTAATGTRPARATCGKASPGRASADFGPGTMTTTLSSSKILQGSDGDVYLVVDLAARDAAATSRPPMNIAIVIDRSGSMAGEKLARAREAARGLVDRLGSADRIAIVQYDDSAQVLVPSTVADGAGKARIYAAIDSIRDGGSTNLYDGLALGRDEVLRGVSGRANRVILLSDGQANVGISDIPSLARVASDASEKGVRISTIGLGLDYNEDLMEALGNAGRGAYYYVREASGLEAVFAGELRALQATVATAAELRIDPACGARVVEVFGHSSRREGDSVIVSLADLAGGDHRKVVVRVQVPAGRAGASGAIVSTLSYATLSGDRRQASTAVGVEVTGDAVAVDSSVDRDAIAKVDQIETATAVRQATEAYDRGEQGKAISIINQRKAEAQTRQQRYKIDNAQMAPSMGVLGSAGDGMSNAPAASPAGAATKKGAKADAYELMK